jgi:hypothetical protein
MVEKREKMEIEGATKTIFMHDKKRKKRRVDPSCNPVTLTSPPLLKNSPLPQMSRTINRRGNSYVINDSLPSDDPSESDMTDTMISDLYEESQNLSKKASLRASWFKILYVLGTITIIIAGVVIGVISFGKNDFLTTAFGLGVTALQTFLTTFSIEKRGVILKDISAKLRKVSWKLKKLQTAHLGKAEKIRQMEDYYSEVDDLDMAIFDNKFIGNQPKPKALPSTSDKKGDSDLNSKSQEEVLYENKRVLSSSLELPKETV